MYIYSLQFLLNLSNSLKFIEFYSMKNKIGIYFKINAVKTNFKYNPLN